MWASSGTGRTLGLKLNRPALLMPSHAPRSCSAAGVQRQHTPVSAAAGQVAGLASSRPALLMPSGAPRPGGRGKDGPPTGAPQGLRPEPGTNARGSTILLHACARAPSHLCVGKGSGQPHEPHVALCLARDVPVPHRKGWHGRGGGGEGHDQQAVQAAWRARTAAAKPQHWGG